MFLIWVSCWDFQKEADGKDEDDEQLDSAERKSHNTDGQTGEENVQCDSAVELAGEASERDDAKEVPLTWTFHSPQ